MQSICAYDYFHQFLSLFNFYNSISIKQFNFNYLIRVAINYFLGISLETKFTERASGKDGRPEIRMLMRVSRAVRVPTFALDYRLRALLTTPPSSRLYNSRIMLCKRRPVRVYALDTWRIRARSVIKTSPEFPCLHFAVCRRRNRTRG